MDTDKVIQDLAKNWSKNWLNEKVNAIDLKS